jgi:hypothetical protein
MLMALVGLVGMDSTRHRCTHISHRRRSPPTAASAVGGERDG